MVNPNPPQDPSHPPPDSGAPVPPQANPYHAPQYGGEAPPGYDQDEIDVTKPSGLVKAAGGLQAATGVLLAFAGIQLKLVGLTGKAWVMMVPWVMILGGVTAVFLALKIFRTRGWAALAGTVLSGIIMLAMGLWVLLTLASGFVSLMATLVPMVALLATVFGGIAIGPCLRASEARRRLQAEDGIDMSF